MAKQEVSKQKAGRILNQLLRVVSIEPTEFWKDISEPGDDRYITKAEAMIRTIYKMALGYKAVRTDEGGGTYTVHVPPDRHMLALIWDRLEGKVGTADDVQERRAKLTDRVTEQGRQRIASAGGVSESG